MRRRGLREGEMSRGVEPARNNSLQLAFSRCASMKGGDTRGAESRYSWEGLPVWSSHVPGLLKRAPRPNTDSFTERCMTPRRRALRDNHPGLVALFPYGRGHGRNRSLPIGRPVPRASPVHEPAMAPFPSRTALRVQPRRSRRQPSPRASSSGGGRIAIDTVAPAVALKPTRHPTPETPRCPVPSVACGDVRRGRQRPRRRGRVLLPAPVPGPRGELDPGPRARGSQ